MNTPNVFAHDGVAYKSNATPDSDISDNNSSLSFAESKINHKLEDAKQVVDAVRPA